MATKANESWSFYFDTNGSKPWFWSISYNPYYSANGSWQHDIAPYFQLRPKPSLTLSAGPELYKGTHRRAILGQRESSTVGRRLTVARLEQTQVSMNVRVDYSATPNLSFQVYLQPLVTTLRYHDLRELDAFPHIRVRVGGPETSRTRARSARCAATRWCAGNTCRLGDVLRVDAGARGQAIPLRSSTWTTACKS